MYDYRDSELGKVHKRLVGLRLGAIILHIFLGGNSGNVWGFKKGHVEFGLRARMHRPRPGKGDSSY